MKIMFIGAGGYLSVEPLKGLLYKGFDVCAIGGDDPGPSPGANPEPNPEPNAGSNHQSFAGIALIDTRINVCHESTVSLARAHRIPFISLAIEKSGIEKQGSDKAKNIREIRYYQPDLIIVSCYSKRLPAEIIAIPRLGCYNIHPSLLPAYRGPDPLFWQLKAGEKKLGVTIHRVTETFDSGDILNQKPLHLMNGVSLAQANEYFAKVATDLLLEVLADFETFQRCETAQVDDLSINHAAEIQPSYQSYAQSRDFEVSVSWTAQRMYNFICAFWQAGRYFNCCINNEVFQLGKALSFDPFGKLDVPYLIDSQRITFACASGFIQCQLVHYHL